jgi:hypothetical protein
MLILHLESSAAAKDILIAELWERGTAGITEQETPDGGCILSAFFEHQFDTSELAPNNPRWEAAEERDWVAVSQSLWSPVLVGRRFYLAPEWSADPTPPGRIRLDMHPGQACGCQCGLEIALTPVHHRVCRIRIDGLLGRAHSLGQPAADARQVNQGIQALRVVRHRLRQADRAAGFEQAGND